MNPNPLNYASLEASKRLVEAGIVLETDFYHCFWEPDQEWILIANGEQLEDDIPAPTLAEVWRELPKDPTVVVDLIFSWHKDIYGKNIWDYQTFVIELFRDINRTIDFLIWVRGGKQHTKVFNAINATSGITKVTP
jgi:hypothetical protein